MAQNSNTSSSLVPHSIYAAGTTGLVTGNATVIPSGCVYAAASVRAPRIYAGTSITSAGAISGTSLTATTGFTFVGNQTYKLAAGTYMGAGGATAPIIATGLTTVHKVFMQRLSTTYATATTNGNYSPRPCRAHGTVGSFYPIILRSSGANGAPTLGLSAGATHSWMALGV